MLARRQPLLALQNYLSQCKLCKYFCQQNQFMFNFFWLELDLPPLPNNLIQQAINCSDDQRIIKSTDRVIHDNGIEYKNGTNVRYRVSPDIHNWVKENIIDDYAEISTQVLSNGPCAGPHLDKLRIYHLFYLIEHGGADHETVWFREPGKPIFRTDFLIFDDYSKLTELHRTKLPVGKWVLFNSKVIHDVQRLNPTLARKTLTIDMMFMPQKFATIADGVNHYSQ